MTIDHPTQTQVPQLKQLWRSVFQDPEDYIDGFFSRGFSPARCRCVTADGEAAAMLHWLDMTCRGKRVAYIYAVATHKKYRGQGFCRALMEDAHALLARRGYAGAALVPENEGLFLMYRKMDYECFGGIRQFVCGRGEGASVTPLTPEQWQQRRAEALPEGGVELADGSLNYLASMTEFYGGADFLLSCVRDGDVLHGIELLGSAAAAPGILTALGCTGGSFRTPGDAPFAMYRSLDGTTPSPGYFGIAFD